MGMWNSLKGWLGLGVLAGSLMLPNDGKSDVLDISNNSSSNPNVGSVYMEQTHYEGAEERYDDFPDIPWSTGPPPPLESKWFNLYTEPYDVPLFTDGRPP
jgi:hypothetical protein